MKCSYLVKLTAVMMLCAVSIQSSIQAELKLPAPFTDNMVLQREMPVRIWGSGEPGEQVQVKFAGQTVVGKVNSDAQWKVELAPLETSSEGRTLQIRTTMGEVALIENVLVGEVWLCSGQSNMEWPLEKSYDGDVEIAAANYPMIRLLSIPGKGYQKGTQIPQTDFDGKWEVCTPETVAAFSAVGYQYGRDLHQALDVPIGLIDNAWGGSSAEAWVDRKVLEADGKYEPYLDNWRQIEASYDHEKVLNGYRARLKKWKADKAAGKRVKAMPTEPGNKLKNQFRPGNLYCGVLHPVIGYGMRGVIWYQGESNAKRAWQYRDLLPLLIQNWRAAWGQGDFPFYIVQLAGHKAKAEQPEGSWWAEVREAQTLTVDTVPNTAQAVTYDVGEERDIHPRDKHTVARRLARIALARDYGMELDYKSARFDSVEIKGNEVIVTFKDVPADGLYTRDSKELHGFALAGEDGTYVWAVGKIVGKNRVTLRAEGLQAPKYVRYAWSENPNANLYTSRMGAPVLPFRTDTFEAITVNNFK